MLILNIEHPRLRREMREGLKRHILRERQRKKEENDKQTKRAEKAKALSSSKVQLEDNAKDILVLQRILTDLEQQKLEQCNLLKSALTEEDRRKHSQLSFTKQPSSTSLYSPNLQMTQYAQKYLSTQQSHRLLAYKSPPFQSQSFIPSKRPRSPSPSNKSSTYSSSQLVTRNGAPAFPSSQSQSVFPGYLNYFPPSSASHTNQMPCVRGSSQIPHYLNPLSFLPQPISDSNIEYLFSSSKNRSVMNGYPLQSQ